MNNQVTPQAKNGHIDIANEIAGALMGTNLTAYQGRVLWAIWRKTYGWHKREDWISNSQFVEMTGLRKQHVYRTLKELEQRNIVTRSGNKIAFNRNYREWEELPKEVTVTSSGYSVTDTGYTVTSTGTYKRNYTKETIQKKNNIYSRVFDFWNSLNIICHRRITDKMRTKINAAFRDFSEDEIFKSMKNYDNVLKSDNFYWTHKWTLPDFLQRGLEKFVDEAEPLINFRRNKYDTINREGNKKRSNYGDGKPYPNNDLR